MVTISQTPTRLIPHETRSSYIKQPHKPQHPCTYIDTHLNTQADRRTSTTRVYIRGKSRVRAGGGSTPSSHKGWRGWLLLIHPLVLATTNATFFLLVLCRTDAEQTALMGNLPAQITLAGGQSDSTQTADNCRLCAGFALHRHNTVYASPSAVLS